MLPWLRGYYAILNVTEDQLDQMVGPSFGELERRAQRLLAAGPCCLQLRAKAASAAVMLEMSAALLPLCRAAKVPYCVNDRLDVALAVGADAVHLGQDDIPLAEARQVAGDRLAIGVSTHGQAQALAAASEGADYIGVGPVFRTESKENPDPTVGLGGLRQICGMVSRPVVAIGGITLPRVREVVSAGAAAAAVISAVDRAEDPTGAGRAISAAFARAAGVRSRGG
jgi:thiamine-phosphate pyrophosphorylase